LLSAQESRLRNNLSYDANLAWFGLLAETKSLILSSIMTRQIFALFAALLETNNSHAKP
jgi:hypothetical protein